MTTPRKDPNAPPDPNEVRPIPDAQHPAGAPNVPGAPTESDAQRFNPTTPGVAPTEEYPIGIPPDPPTLTPLREREKAEKEPAPQEIPVKDPRPAAAAEEPKKKK
jgi:hypothetical protein